MNTPPYRTPREPVVSKDVWGPQAWQWLHEQSIQYPSQPSSAMKAAAHAQFWSFIHGLPCAECRIHATQYAQDYPPDFSSGERFQTWSWRFHNAVNYRLGKPIMDAREYRNQYADVIARSYWQHV
jgi:hypothetical protein